MKVKLCLAIILLLAGAFLPLISELASASSSDNWSMFHRDLTRSGYSTAPSFIPSNNPVWNFTTNGPVSASPTVVNDRIYIGSLRGIAYCLNAKDGSLVWNFTIHLGLQGPHGGEAAAIGSSMAVANGHVFFGAYDRNVYCLDASTGNKVWNYTTGNTVESSPAIDNGDVYVGSWDGNVYCLDALSGAKIWSFKTGSQIESSPAVVDGKVFVGSVDGSVYCLNASTGDKIWSYATGKLVQSSPAVVNGRVYIGSEDTNLYCLDASTGAKIWSYSTEGWVDSSPAVANGYVYVGCAKIDAAQDDLPSNIYCLNAFTGDKVWNFTMKGGASYSSPAITSDLLYMGDWANNIYCLNITTGAEIWAYTTGAHVNSSPAIVGGSVFVASWDHRVYAFGTSSTVTEPFSINTEYLLILGVIAAIVVVMIYFYSKEKGKQTKGQNKCLIC